MVYLPQQKTISPRLKHNLKVLLKVANFNEMIMLMELNRMLKDG